MGLLSRLRQRRARRLGIKLSSVALIDADAEFLIESPAAIGRVTVMLPKGSQMRLGAHSFIRNGELHDLDTIGRFCSIGRAVVIGQDGRNHPLDWVSTSHRLCRLHRAESRSVCIGHDVWIGDGAVVMAGVHIGTGAVIARNALVTRDVEPYQIVGGNPARPIRYRFDPVMVQSLLASAWWDYPLADLDALDYSRPEQFLQQLAGLEKGVRYPCLRIGGGRVEPCEA